MKTIYTLIFLFISTCIFCQYKLPFPVGASFVCTQGNNTSGSHNGIEKYAFDFSMPTGSIVCASRAGVVKEVTIDANWNDGNCPYSGGCSSNCINKVNRIVIDHLDGTYSLYLHLTNTKSTLVTVGQSIGQGENIAYSGNSGCSSGPHLHFMVMNNYPSWYSQSIQVSFDDFYTNNGIPKSADLCTSGPFAKPINDNLEVYAGSRNAPKNNIKIWVDLPATGISTSFSLTSLKVNNTSIGSPTTKISNKRYNSTLTRAIFDLDLTSLASTTGANGPFDLEFELTYGSSVYKYYTKSKLYFLDPTEITDVSNSDWLGTYYIPKGIKNGLFKGFKDASGNAIFQPYTTLTKGQACKVIVAAMTKLSDVFVVDATGTPPLGVNPASELFPYIQTCYNKGWLPLVSGAWNQSETIDVNQIVYMLYRAFELNNATASDKPRNYKSKTSLINFNVQSALQIRQLEAIFVQNTHLVNSLTMVENIASLFPHTTANPANASTTDVIDCNTKITRGTMAKLITNLFVWKASKNGVTTEGVTTPTSDYFVLGDKYESTDQPIGNIPALSTQIQSSYTINDNQTLTISHNSSTDAANGGIPLYFYWTASGGDTLQALTTDFRSIKFKPSTVTTQTIYKLYSQCGNTNGKIREYFIDVVVNPTNPASTTTTPTIQATNLQVTSSTYNSINVSWTRGNGSYCLVTACPTASNVVHPQLNNIYTGNANFSAAGVVGNDTKILYSGTGSSLNITGLQANTGYKIFVYEYNGNTAATVKYLTTPLCFNVAYTQPPINTVAAISYNSPLVNGVAQLIIGGSSQNANTHSWSVSPSATISSTTAMNPYFTFPNTGTYTITLTASNTATGQADTKSITVNVLNAATNLPDLVVQNLSISPSSVIAGQSINVTCTAVNTNTNVPSITNGFGVKYYISDDQIYDASDYAVGAEPLVFTNKFSEVVTHSVIVPNNFSGTKYILAVVDYNNYVAETNETNNISSVSLPIVAAKCDLTPTTASTVASVASGVKFAVNYTVNNLGAVENLNQSYVGFYISKDNLYSSDDYFISSPHTVSVFPNTPVNYKDSILVPNWWPSGTYYIVVYIDDPWTNNSSWFNDETNENNNIYYLPITISNPNQPSIQVSNIKITNVTSNSLQLSWTNGNGNRRLVIGWKGYDNYPSLPTDGTTYTANANWSLATTTNNFKTLYNGTGSTVNISGLAADTTYYFRIYEFNSTSLDYLQNGTNNTIHAHTVNNNNGWQTIKNDYRTIYGLHFISSDTGFINAPWGISSTFDSGKSWNINQYITQYNLDYSSTTQGQKISFLENNHTIGFLANGSSLFRTTNKGITWKRIVSIPNKLIQSFFALDSNTIYFISSTPGNSYELRKTTNGGTTSSIILSSTFSSALNSVYFINSNIGIVASGVGKFYRTLDGGVTWSNYDLNNNAQYPENSDLYLNSKYGIYADYYGRIYKTIDTGKTWLLKYNLATTGILSPTIKFYNTTTGIVILNNKIAKTFDGGETWTIATNPTTTPTYCVGDIVNENTIYFASDGYLAKSNTGGLSNAITITNSLPINLCPNSNIVLKFSKTGSFNANDTILMELSDTSGAFVNAIVLSQKASTINNDSIVGYLPSNFLSSTKYKLRLRTKYPSVISNSTNNLQFSTAPVLSFTNLQNSYATSTTAFTLAATPSGGSFKINGSASTSFNATTLGAGNHIVTYTYSIGSCVYTIQKTVIVFIPKSISLGTISTTSVCAGASITLPYTLAGTFDSTNILTVQLSNNVGAFSSPISLGSFSTSISGNLIVNIPTSVTSATAYKLRIVNTDTSVISNTSSNINISNNIIPTISISSLDTICSGSNLLFTSSGTNLGTTPLYQWYVNGSLVGSNNSIYSSNSFADGDVVQLKVTSNATCVSSPTVFSQYKIISVITNPDTPTIAAFDSILVSSSPYNNQWYFNGALIIGATDQFYVAHQNGLYQVRVKATPCSIKNSLLFNYVKQADYSTISGNIISPIKKPIQNVIFKIQGDSNTTFTASGSYLSSLVATKNYLIKPSKNNDIVKANGINATDVLFTQRHILNTTKLNNAYKLIAADVDGNKVINATDILRMKRLILGTDTTFKNTLTNENRMWVFVDSSFNFSDTTNPFPFKDSILFNSISGNKNNQTFIGVKLGDVTWDWNSSVLKSTQKNSVEMLMNTVNTKNLIIVDVNFNKNYSLTAFQGTLNFDNNIYEFVEIKDNSFNVDFNVSNANQTGNISFLWLDKNGYHNDFTNDNKLFTIVFKQKTFNQYNNILDIQLSNQITEAFALDKNLVNNKLKIIQQNIVSKINKLSIYPNPTSNNVVIESNSIKEIKLINQLGQIIYKIPSLATDKYLLNLNKIAKGLYIIQILDADGYKQEKLVIE